MVGCGSGDAVSGGTEASKISESTETSSEPDESQTNEQITITQSPDKYTWYMQNYVGRNLASCGYTSLGGDRNDEYGDGYIKLCLVNADGSYIDIEDDDDLKQYVVVAQSVEPNTEFKYEYETDEDGEEYSNLIQWQSIEQIDLLVKKIDEDLSDDAPELVEIEAAPDQYSAYIRNYVGKNLSMVGYSSLGGDRMDQYGQAYVELLLVADDGTYIDVEDEEAIKEYYVTGQDVAPNTLLTYTMEKDSEGNEYSNLIDSQSIEKITLYVSHLNN
jgi:hypothetical protein